MRVTGLVLAAGGSRRLGAAKQLLPFRGRTLLDATPGVRPSGVRRLLESSTPLAVCRYADGLGHPFLFHRSVFGDLTGLHGDKAVWKPLHSGRYPVTEIDTAGTVPIDVDTRDDYERLLAHEQS